MTGLAKAVDVPTRKSFAKLVLPCDNWFLPFGLRFPRASPGLNRARSDVTKSRLCDPAARIFLTLLALLSMQSVTALGQIDQSKFREDLKVLAAQPRVIGSIGYTQAADYIQREIRRIQDAGGRNLRW